MPSNLLLDGEMNIFQLAVTYLSEVDLMSTFSNMPEDISCGCRKDAICFGAVIDTGSSSARPLRCLALWRQPKRNTALKTTVSARYRWSRCSSASPSSSTAQTAGGYEAVLGLPAPPDCTLDSWNRTVEEHCYFYCCVVGLRSLIYYEYVMRKKTKLGVNM